VNTVCKPRGIHHFALRIDNAGELTSHEVQAYCAENGIHLVPPRIQRGGREVLRHAAVHDPLHAGVHAHATFLWNHAARHACRLIGVCPKAPDWTTPDWKWVITALDSGRALVARCTRLLWVLAMLALHMFLNGYASSTSVAVTYRPYAILITHHILDLSVFPHSYSNRK
jgi:hypothetical protein